MTNIIKEAAGAAGPAAGQLINVTPHEGTLSVAVPVTVTMTPAARDALLPHASTADDERRLDRLVRNVSAAAEAAGFHVVREARCQFAFAGLLVRKGVAPDGTFTLTVTTPAEAPPIDVTAAARRAGFAPPARVTMTASAHRELFPHYGEPPEDDRRLLSFLAALHARLAGSGYLRPDDLRFEFDYRDWVVTKGVLPDGRPELVILTKREEYGEQADEWGDD